MQLYWVQEPSSLPSGPAEWHFCTTFPVIRNSKRFATIDGGGRLLHQWNRLPFDHHVCRDRRHNNANSVPSVCASVAPLTLARASKPPPGLSIRISVRSCHNFGRPVYIWCKGIAVRASVISETHGTDANVTTPPSRPPPSGASLVLSPSHAPRSLARFLSIFLPEWLKTGWR